MRSSRRMPFFILGLIVLIWGYLFVPGKLGVTDSSVFVWAGMRTLPAYLILLALLFLLRRPLRPKADGGESEPVLGDVTPSPCSNSQRS
jgi:drug/metabolite transporter (DMT)-like permease